MASITFENVSKVYPGGNKAVDDLSLQIVDREFVVFVGPSGCGKSTTLRMIAGLEENTSGNIYIGDMLVNGMEPKDRNVAMVFQSYALYRHMSVYDNMAFALKIAKMPKAEIDRRVREIAEVLGITPLLKRKPNALSGGECQRVALGRALVRNPQVFLFDEPLSNLDAKLRTSMRAEIIRLHGTFQTTFVYVTHDQTEAMTMGDRIVVMDKGRIRQVDTPQNVYDYPANIFTAGFIGTPQMNFFETSLRRGENGFFVPFGERTLSLSGVNASEDELAGHEDTAVTLGIRPENLRIEREDTGDNCLGEAVIEFIELLGSGMNVHLSLAGARFIVTAPADVALKLDMSVFVSADLDRMHVFDAASGDAITGKHARGGDTPQ